MSYYDELRNTRMGHYSITKVELALVLDFDHEQQIWNREELVWAFENASIWFQLCDKAISSLVKSLYNNDNKVVRVRWFGKYTHKNTHFMWRNIYETSQEDAKTQLKLWIDIQNKLTPILTAHRTMIELEIAENSRKMMEYKTKQIAQILEPTSLDN